MLNDNTSDQAPATNVVPFPVDRLPPRITDEVICRRDGRRGYIERLLYVDGIPTLAGVRVYGGFGVRVLKFSDFDRAPTAPGQA